MELVKSVYTKVGSEKVENYRIDVSAIYKVADDTFVSAQATIFDESKNFAARVGFASKGGNTTLNINGDIAPEIRTTLITKIMNVFDTL